MRFFGAAQGWGKGGGGGKKDPHPKICHAYPTMMELDTLPKEDPKTILFT